MKYKNKDKTCIVCNRQGVDLHHVKTRGSGGSDEEFNLMPLCRWHHSQIHTEGLNKLSMKYRVRNWLEDNDYVYDAYIARWIHCDD